MIFLSGWAFASTTFRLIIENGTAATWSVLAAIFAFPAAFTLAICKLLGPRTARWIAGLLILLIVTLPALWEYEWHRLHALPVTVGEDGVTINHNGAIRAHMFFAPIILLFTAINALTLGLSFRLFNRQIVKTTR